jgi:hypothetical protein
MRRSIVIVATLALAAFALAASASAAQAEPAPDKQEEKPVTPREVTIKGMVLNHHHTGQKGPSVFIYVLDGPPEIKAEFDRIMTEFYPEKGLDADAARALQGAFTARLMYYIDGPLADELLKDATYNARQVRAVTGVIREEGGKRWITATKCEESRFQYPAVMLAPDKPMVMPDREPLLLKISGQLSLKYIYVPPGRFFMGEPYYMCPHWQEDPPHMVTLTKGYYMAECPVTWAMYEAVTGRSATDERGPGAPANVSCADAYEFCRVLSERSGRKVRLPTAAEWDYAARVGTSNPPFAEKFKDQKSDAAGPVKCAAPNAWGFYDMFSTGWERVSDGPDGVERRDTVDPRHIPPEDSGQADATRKHGHIAKGNSGYAIGEIEYITSEAGPPDVYPGVLRFRVVVEGAAEGGDEGQVKTEESHPTLHAFELKPYSGPEDEVRLKARCLKVMPKPAGGWAELKEFTIYEFEVSEVPQNIPQRMMSEGARFEVGVKFNAVMAPALEAATQRMTTKGEIGRIRIGEVYVLTITDRLPTGWEAIRSVLARGALRMIPCLAIDEVQEK